MNNAIPDTWVPWIVIAAFLLLAVLGVLIVMVLRFDRGQTPGDSSEHEQE